MFEKSKEILSAGDLVIYPAVDPVRINGVVLTHRYGGGGIVGRGGGDEIAGVRPERQGDDPRDIYWRKSTLQRHRVLRERGKEISPEIRLPLDLHNDAKEEFALRFERTIRDLASRAVAHVKRGDRVTVITSTGGRVRVDRLAGIDPLLRFLALIEPSPPDASTPLLSTPLFKGRSIKS